MGITIKDIAREANVSVATVSHVINKTRYVSPELVERVETIMEQSGYSEKIQNKVDKIRTGKSSEIALLVPNFDGAIFSQLASVISTALLEKNYVLSTYLTDDNIKKEKHILHSLLANKRIVGFIIIPVSTDPKHYRKLLALNKPVVFLDRAIPELNVCSILSENVRAMQHGTEHLIKCGHESIGLLLDCHNHSTTLERLEGYRQALDMHGIGHHDAHIVRVSLDTKSANIFDRFEQNGMPTAFIAGNNELTLKLLKDMEEIGLECPRDISIMGFGDSKWGELLHPPLTALQQDPGKMGQLAAEKIIAIIDGGTCTPTTNKVPVNLIIRKSTQIIGAGPFGERTASPEQIIVTDEEIEALRAGHYKVAMSFHYSGDTWTRLHEQAIRHRLNMYGIKLLTVTDSYLDPKLQITQLEGLIMQKPDAIISVPSDDEITAEKFKEISALTKLILIDNMPNSFTSDDYAAWISVNERENGRNVGKIVRDHFKEQENVKIGMLTHGVPFLATRQRDSAVEQLIRDYCPNIEIVAKRDFYYIENAYSVCLELLREYPDLHGLYISWDRPALEAIRALEDMQREDIIVATADLDTEIASYLAKGKYVIGLSAQRPYEQGLVVADATAKALLGKTQHKCIVIPPTIVLPKNLKKAWMDVMREPRPDFI